MAYTELGLSDSLQDAAGTFLEDHTPDGAIAFDWTKYKPGASLQFDATNGLARLNVAFDTITRYAATTAPESDNYRMRITASVVSTDSSASIGGLLGRIDPTLASNRSIYFGVRNSASGTPVYEIIGFGTSGISFMDDELVIPAELIGTDILLELDCTDNVFTGYANGAQVLQLTDTGNILATGLVGLTALFRTDRASRLHGPWGVYMEPPPPPPGGYDTLSSGEITANAATVLLDRRVTSDSAGVSVAFDGTDTTWTVPYAVAVDGSEGTLQVVRTGLSAVGDPLVATRPAPTQIRVAGADYSEVAVALGISYEFRYEFSTLFPRKREGQADTQGRLQLSRAKLRYRDSKAFDVEVTPVGRAQRTYTFSAADTQDGDHPFQINTQNKTATIVVVNDSPFPSVITGLDWEGTLVNRSRRI